MKPDNEAMARSFGLLLQLQELVAEYLVATDTRKKDVDYILGKPKGWTKRLLRESEPSKVSVEDIAKVFWVLGLRLDIKVSLGHE